MCSKRFPVFGWSRILAQFSGLEAFLSPFGNGSSSANENFWRESRTSKGQLPNAVFWDILEKGVAAGQAAQNQCLFAAVLHFKVRSSVTLSFPSLKIFTEVDLLA